MIYLKTNINSTYQDAWSTFVHDKQKVMPDISVTDYTDVHMKKYYTMISSYTFAQIQTNHTFRADKILVFTLNCTHAILWASVWYFLRDALYLQCHGEYGVSIIIFTCWSFVNNFRPVMLERSRFIEKYQFMFGIGAKLQSLFFWCDYQFVSELRWWFSKTAGEVIARMNYYCHCLCCGEHWLVLTEVQWYSQIQPSFANTSKYPTTPHVILYIKCMYS